MRNYTYTEGGVFIANKANMAEQYGIGQYRYPHNYELVGRSFTVEAEGREYAIEFTCRCGALLNRKKVECEILKCAPGLYFARLGFNVAVIDLNASAATLILEGEIIRGVFKGAEGAAAHACAGDEMVDTKVRWVLGCGRYLEQRFLSADRLLASWSPRDEKRDETSYRAVKVGGPYFLVDMKSDILKNVCAPFFIYYVSLLQDYDRCMAFGCVFGKGFDPIMVTGYAKFID